MAALAAVTWVRAPKSDEMDSTVCCSSSLQMLDGQFFLLLPAHILQTPCLAPVLSTPGKTPAGAGSASLPSPQAKPAAAAYLGEGQTAALCSDFEQEAIFGRAFEGRGKTHWCGENKEHKQRD